MANMRVQGEVQAAEIRAVVIRCRCGNAVRVHPGTVCPLGERIELGPISYYHKNPFRTAWFNLRRKMFEWRHRQLYR